ncbi:nitrite reductase small subunit NirD [Paenibacillus sp. LMG 31456]|uniref:Nitrite reductase small subunit NirD n=1 Tax=Paenibacillus foliorum TaxID=2654974 RepID=A0A972GMH5_9BACL|nr:nitrite reductase small subunit NirD [Paenibacillus foliorum]NOU92998.1 nitrite reductase small subunit NirD [Paenibacillus foliorum]
MERLWIAHVEDIPKLRSRTVRVGGMEIAVFKLSSGELYAVENRCPHKNGKLSEGIVCDHLVFCPLHDWRIDVKDGLVQAPDEGCVATFPVEVEASGQVYLIVNKDVLSA